MLTLTGFVQIVAGVTVPPAGSGLTPEAFLKVTGRTPAADRRRITRATVRALVPDAYDARVVLESDDDDPAARDARFAEPMSEYDALVKYLETNDDIGDERDEVLRLGRDLIDEVLT